MDSEKIIKGAIICEPSKYKRVCYKCPYREEENCDYVLYHDIVELLKEQQKLIDEITQRRANSGAFD